VRQADPGALLHCKKSRKIYGCLLALVLPVDHRKFYGDRKVRRVSDLLILSKCEEINLFV
jgi:hypothetical protein